MHDRPGDPVHVDRLVFIPVAGLLLCIWVVVIAFSMLERGAVLDRARSQLGLSVEILADSEALIEGTDRESEDRKLMDRAGAIWHAKSRYPTARIWFDRDGAVFAGVAPADALQSYLVISEIRNGFAVNAAIPLVDILAGWRRSLWVRAGTLTALTIVTLVVAGFLTKTLRQRAAAMAGLHRHDTILRVLTKAAASLLNAHDHDAAIAAVLASIGPAIGVDRVTLTRLVLSDDKRILVMPGYEWHKPELRPLADQFSEAGVELTDYYSPEQMAKIANGEPVQSYAEDYPEPGKTHLLNMGLLSNLSYTMAIDHRPYGSLAFNDAHAPRRAWTWVEIDTLKALGELIAAAIIRARSATELQQTMARLQLRDRALENINQGALIVETKAPDYPVIYTNPAFAALIRSTTDEIIGRRALSFYDANTAFRLMERVANPEDLKRPRRAEVPMKRNDGTSFLASVKSSMIIGQNGEITHAIAIIEDITDLRRREEMMVDAHRMESVGQLTGGIAHDFNNLLTAIISNAEDLRDGLKDNSSLQSQAEIVLEAADRGAGLVAQLMAFARKQELQPEAVDVNALLDTLAKLLRSTLPAHVEIKIHKAESLPAVYVDPSRLRTTILNLALNARDAMPESGTLTIETSLKALDAEYVAEHLDAQQGSYVMIAITDTGAGMAPEVLERAFVPFFTTKEVGKGRGLGLSMVYGFVKQSGGHARIYSEVGLGTVVKIYLPALDQSGSSDNPSVVVAAAPSGSGKILLVEDDPLVRRSVGDKLARLGYAVVAVGNALDAIKMLKNTTHFDLVFSDVIMPGPMNGADLISEVRRRWPATHVLLTSGYTESTASGKVTLPADVLLLSKPYSNDELANAIRGAMGKRPDSAG